MSSTRRTHKTADLLALQALNEEYIAAFMQGDVNWYKQHLASHFVCIESDGSVLDKTKFLRNTARGPDVRGYELENVRVRMFGDVALVHGTGLFTRQNGTSGRSRYTDVYIRNGRNWRVVSAQITRTPTKK